MEYTQWDITDCLCRGLTPSLNPCCNGIYSMRTSIKCLTQLSL